MGAQDFLDRVAAVLGRKRPPVDLRADTWRPGDLAECIYDNWHEQLPRLPKVREILRVVSVEDHVVAGRRDWWLGFSGFPANHHFAGSAFRKIVPADQGFEASIRRVRPTTKKARLGLVVARGAMAN